LAHPFVIGELALGNLPRRDQALRELQDLPQANIATIEKSYTSSIGIGSSGWVSAMSMLICLRRSA